MKLAKCILFILIIGNSAKSQTQSHEAIIDHFFNIYKLQGQDNALDSIVASNKYFIDNFEELIKLKNSLQKVKQVYGVFIGYEVIKKKLLGKSLAYYVIVVKYERSPMIFKLLFYKPKENWQLQNIKFQDSIEEQLEAPSQ